MNTYKFIEKVDALPVSLAEVKAHLRLDSTDASEDTSLTLYINAASDFFEAFTGTYLITTTFRMFADNWDCYYELKRSRLQSISNVKYYDVDGVQQTVSTDDYYNTDETYYSKVVFENSYTYPTLQGHLQDISIDFKVGFGDAGTDIPNDIKLGLLEHINAIYSNRGDCVDGVCSNLVPSSTKLAYSKYKIIDIGGC